MNNEKALCEALIKKIENGTAISIDDLDEKEVTKTFGVVLPNWELGANDEKILFLKDKLITDYKMSDESFFFSVSYAPYNVNKFVLSIYAISHNEEECISIISNVKSMLVNEKIEYTEFVSELHWKNDRLFYEQPVNIF